MPPETRHDYQLTQAPATLLDGAIDRRAQIAGLMELTKPRLSFLSVITALVGYLCARPERDFSVLFNFLCGTALSAGGAASLNQWFERRTDALMRRTQNRPIPMGVISPAQAFAWGMLLSVAGVVQLLLGANTLAAALAAATILSYILIYTPLKRRTHWNTEVGAISGAIPPLIGWAAARGSIDGLGWFLFAILLFWQIPHFLAIAWTYRRDYEAADFPMLTVVDKRGLWTAAWSLINTVALVGVTGSVVALGYTSWLFAGAAGVLGALFIGLAARMLSRGGRDKNARHVFFYSIFYLPALLAFLVIDRW